MLKCFRKLLERWVVNSKSDHSHTDRIAISFVWGFRMSPVAPSADDLIHPLTRDTKTPCDRSLRLNAHETEHLFVRGTGSFAFPSAPSPLLQPELLCAIRDGCRANTKPPCDFADTKATVRIQTHRRWRNSHFAPRWISIAECCFVLAFPIVRSKLPR